MANITVRPFEPSDIEAMHRLMTSPKVVEGTLQLPLQPLERFRKRWSEFPDGTYPFVACVDGEVVGNLTINIAASPRRRHVGQLGMAVRDDWQGKSVGTALMRTAIDFADNWLNLKRIELQVYTDNAAGIALYQKFGFVIEGTHTAFAFRNGQYVDAYAMARVRDI